MDQISPFVLNFQQITESKKPSAQIVQAELKTIFDNFMRNSSNDQVAVDTIKAFLKYKQDFVNEKYEEELYPRAYHGRKINSHLFGELMDNPILNEPLENLAQHNGLKKILNYFNYSELATNYTSSMAMIKDGIGVIIEAETNLISVYLPYDCEMASHSTIQSLPYQRLIDSLVFFQTRHIPIEYARTVYNAILQLISSETIFSSHDIEIIKGIIDALEDFSGLQSSDISTYDLHNLKIRLNDYTNTEEYLFMKFNFKVPELQEEYTAEEIALNTQKLTLEIKESNQLQEISSILRKISLLPEAGYGKLQIALALNQFIKSTGICYGLLETEIAKVNPQRCTTHLRYYPRFLKFIELENISKETIAEDLPDLSKAISISKIFMTNWEKLYRKDLCINTEKLLSNMSML